VPIIEDVARLYETWVGWGGEGIVLKEPGSIYRPGIRSPAWLKVKPKLTLEITQAMKQLGWVDGQNILIEWRFHESDDQLHAAAAELVRLKVDVLVVPSCGVATIAQKHSRAIPIVILGCGSDMVTAGFATSLARPGGNITGSQILGVDLIGKRLQILKELLPNLSRFATLEGRPYHQGDQSRGPQCQRCCGRCRGSDRWYAEGCLRRMLARRLTGRVPQHG